MSELEHPEVYDACMAAAAKCGGTAATPWIHLAEAVEIGSISPMEAYEALQVGYLPENLKVRKSRYAHLLR